MQFTHNALPTTSIEACLHFYQVFCAMRKVKDRVQNGTRVVWLAPKDQNSPILVFIAYPPLSKADQSTDPMVRHLGFELKSRADVDRVFLALQEDGIPSTKPVYVDEITGYVCMAKDPDGRWVEFSAGQDTSPKNWDSA